MSKTGFVARHKWGEDVYIADDEAGFNAKALELLTQRVNDGYWYDDWNDGNDNHQWLTRANAIVQEGDGEKAWDFLESRSDFEYEWVEEVYPR